MRNAHFLMMFIRFIKASQIQKYLFGNICRIIMDTNMHSQLACTLQRLCNRTKYNTFSIFIAFGNMQNKISKKNTIHQQYQKHNHTIIIKVRKGGLEPPQVKLTTTSRQRVYQFRHFRKHYLFRICRMRRCEVQRIIVSRCCAIQ